MRVVPGDRLLIQPTVQLSWIRQHGELEFQVPAELQAQFRVLWQRYQATALPTVGDFVKDAQAQPFLLHENDQLFALLVGADYITSHLGPVDILTGQPNLLWRLL